MNIPLDKIYHFIVGFLIYVVTYLTYFLAQLPSVLYGLPSEILFLGIVLLAGVIKEVADKKIKKSMFDYFDMFATIVGGVVGLFAVGLVAKVVG